MKDYKGLYHKEKTIVPCYEHGAHFKYLDLVNALLDLQINLSNKNNIENQEINYSTIKNDILLIKGKIDNTKQYNLKTNLLLIKKNENQRYNNINKIDFLNKKKNNETNNNNLLFNESNQNLFHKREKLKFISKSINKKDEKLPIINSINNSNSISLRNKSVSPYQLTERIIYDFDNDKINTNINEIKVIKEYSSKNNLYENNNIHNEISNKMLIKYNKNKRNIDSIEILPDINSFHYNHHLTYENGKKKLNVDEFEKTKSQILGKNTNKIKIKPINKKSHKGLSRIFLNAINNKNYSTEKTDSHKSKKVKIKSIFETEKQIKNNNLLTDRKNFYRKNNFETINNDMAKQIYLLKKNLLNNVNK